MEKRQDHTTGTEMDVRGTMTSRAIGGALAGLLLLTAPAIAAESPAELISSYRLKHGEVRVVRDSTLDRIALGAGARHGGQGHI